MCLTQRSLVLQHSVKAYLTSVVAGSWSMMCWNLYKLSLICYCNNDQVSLPRSFKALSPWPSSCHSILTGVVVAVSWVARLFELPKDISERYMPNGTTLKANRFNKEQHFSSVKLFAAAFCIHVQESFENWKSFQIISAFVKQGECSNFWCCNLNCKVVCLNHR